MDIETETVEVTNTMWEKMWCSLFFFFFFIFSFSFFVQAEFNPDFIRNMMAKIEWSALVSAAEAVGVGIGLPEAMPEPAQADDDFLKSVHTVLMEVDIQSGRMVCPRCDHVYVITDGIPNMLLHEDEV